MLKRIMLSACRVMFFTRLAGINVTNGSRAVSDWFDLHAAGVLLTFERWAFDSSNQLSLYICLP
jgi:hypothetical protein